MARMAHQVSHSSTTRMISMTVRRPVYCEATSSDAPNSTPGSRKAGAQMTQAGITTARNLGGLNNTGFVYTVFRHDATTGTTSAVTTFDSGDPGGGSSRYPMISSDGQWIVFQSNADLDGEAQGGPALFVTQTGGSFVQLTWPVWSIPSGVGACTHADISAASVVVAPVSAIDSMPGEAIPPGAQKSTADVCRLPINGE